MIVAGDEARQEGSELPLGYPPLPELLPDWSLKKGRLRVRFARDEADLRRTLELRYAVFGVEKGCSIDASGGRERDVFDAAAHHLMVIDEREDEVVGTYRLITAELARLGPGFYSASEFDLDRMPSSVLDQAVELGRACIAPHRRGGAALALLFAGFTQYLIHNRKRYFFGCASVPTLDPITVAQVYDCVRARGAIHPEICVPALPGYRGPDVGEMTPPESPIKLPALVERYLGLGARVCSQAAFDSDWKGTDWLVLLDVAGVDPAIVDGFSRGRP